MSEDAVLLEPGVQIRPQMTHEDVVDLAERLYNLKHISITEFNAYDDKNYHIQVPTTERQQNGSEHGYVLKVINTLDSKKLDFIEAQTQLMIYLGAHGVQCPQPVKNQSGQYFSSEKLGHKDNSETSSEHVVRLLTFQPGKILYQVQCNNDLFYQAGKYIANVDKVLEGFHHPAYDTHRSLWMLESVPQVRKFLYVITDKTRLKFATDVLDAFDSQVLPVIPGLKRGILHGDFNEQNILVREKENGEGWDISAVIDFGDTHISCYVFELAITICYMMFMCKEGDVLDVGGHVLAGYSTIRTLPDQEFQVLKTCVSSRLCQSVVLGAYSHLQDPTNKYLLTSQEGGWRLLTRLADTPQGEVERRWKAVMASYEK